jgi:hypothetical protein
VDEKFGSGEGDVASTFFTTSFQNRVERWGKRKPEGLLRTLICYIIWMLQCAALISMLEEVFQTISNNTINPYPK